MHFRVQTDEINFGLGMVTRAISPRPAKDAYNGVLIETDADSLVLTCTDGEISIKARVSAMVEEEGLALLPARLFAEMMRKQPAGEVDVRVDEPFNPLPFAVGGIVAICLLLAGLWRVKRRAAAREAVAARNAADEALRDQMLVLKQRVNSADSREWLLELESICKGYVARKFGMATADPVNLDNLVKEGKLEGWETLIEEFAHARYGGGKRDSFENRETWKAAMRLMGVEEE